MERQYRELSDETKAKISQSMKGKANLLHTEKLFQTDLKTIGKLSPINRQQKIR